MRVVAAFALGLCACACANPDVPLPTEADELDQAIVRELEKAEVPGGQVALARDGEIRLNRAYGYADTRTDRRNTTETRFLAASVSKLVTGVAILQLAATDRLDLDANVADILGLELRHPDHPNAAITSRGLLTHTAGSRDNWSLLEKLYTPHDPDVSLDQFVRGYYVEGGEFYNAKKNWQSEAPGTTFDYSNAGFALLGRIVEVVDGRDFATYCQDEIFDPLEMNQTTWFFEELDENLQARPTRWSRGFEPVDHYSFVDYPSGALRTTARDLGLFALALLEPDRLLPQSMLDEAWTVAFPSLEDEQALAFYWWELDGENVVGHNGSETGVSSELAIRPAHSDIAVVLLNGVASGKRFAKLERLLFETAAAD